MLGVLRVQRSPTPSERGSAAWCMRTHPAALPFRNAAAVGHPAESSQTAPPGSVSAPHAGTIVAVPASSRGPATAQMLIHALVPCAGNGPAKPPVYSSRFL